MRYIYGDFTDNQIAEATKAMHNDIHKLLLHKDNKIKEQIFNSEEDFNRYFVNLLFRFGGLNELLGEPKQMVALMSTLQAAYDEIKKDNFNYSVFRNAILNSHGYIKAIFEGGDFNAKFKDC